MGGGGGGGEGGWILHFAKIVSVLIDGYHYPGSQRGFIGLQGARAPRQKN